MINRDYSDIINIHRPEPQKHKRATRLARAAQFGAFRALTGHEEAVLETARLTDRRIFLDEYEKEKLFDRIALIMKNIDKKPKVTITYFEPDEKKSGGKYIDFNDIIKKIDEYNGVIITENNIIKLDRVIGIQSEFFDCYDI